MSYDIFCTLLQCGRVSIGVKKSIVLTVMLWIIIISVLNSTTEVFTVRVIGKVVVNVKKFKKS